MKFLYEFRTPDNEKHQGEIRASDKESAYALLKSQGVRPCGIKEAPGLFNKVFGKGKRWIAIAVLGAACLALAVFSLRVRQQANSQLPTDESRRARYESELFDGRTRRQPIGDSAIIDEGIRTGWSQVFEHEGERFLASFAIPGVSPAVRSTTAAEVQNALAIPARVAKDEGIESRQMRAMVEGMKQELRDFLAAGGSVAAYGRRLVHRQEEELAYYHRAKNEVENAVKNGESPENIETLLRTNNTALRKMGIRPVVLTER